MPRDGATIFDDLIGRRSLPGLTEGVGGGA